MRDNACHQPLEPWRRILRWLVTGVPFALLIAIFTASCMTFGGIGAGPFTTVVIDAGHGGHDRGATSRVGPNEKTHALDISKRVANELRKAGFRVILSRSTDDFISLGERVRISNRQWQSIFVSIHLNSARRRAAAGTETFYHTRNSKRLAANIQYELARVTTTPNRGVKHARFYVLRNNNRPAVLVECGFLSNYGEAKKFLSASYRQRIAEAIARGIIWERRNRNP